MNIHRISEYIFPDCAGPPRSLSGIEAGVSKSTDSMHFSVSGSNCVNNAKLESLARNRAKEACTRKITAQTLCQDIHHYENDQQCRKSLINLCASALYTTFVIKSRYMRAADDWLVSRCHQNGQTLFGALKNWRANEEAVGFSDDIPNMNGRPLIRAVRQGNKFSQVYVDFTKG